MSNVLKRSFFYLNIMLVSSLCTNVFCITHIIQQNKQMCELIERNNQLMESINKLHLEVAQFGEEITVINSKSLPMATDNGYLSNPIFLFCVVTLGIGLFYFYSSGVWSKLIFPKLVTVAPVIKKLSLLEQDLIYNVDETNAIILVKLINNDIHSMYFKYEGDDAFLPIEMAIKAYIDLNNKNIPTIGTSSLEETLSPLFATDGGKTFLDVADSLANIV